MLDVTTTEFTLQPPFRHGGGKRWIAALPSGFAGPSDTNKEPVRSNLRLQEDGTLLGPPHATHDAIGREGGGRYSHWIEGLYFSSSDGSDPNLNGRSYTAVIGVPTPHVLGLGSCNLYEALALLQARGLAYCRWQDPVLSYSPREALQLIEFHAGGLEIPEALHPFTIANTPGAIAAPTEFLAADLAFLEFGSSIDVAFGSYWIPRGQLLNNIMNPIAALGKTGRRTANRWYHQGIIKQNETVRRECSEQLLELLPFSGVDARLASEIITDARGHTQDPADVALTIAAIQDSIRARATFVVSTQNAFTPDGRPMTWPGNFSKQLESVCQTLGLPLLHPSRLVSEHGGEFSLERDLIHFTPRFLSLLGDEMMSLGLAALNASNGAVGRDSKNFEASSAK